MGMSWTREIDQRARDHEYAVFTSGPFSAKYQVTHMTSGRITKTQTFTGETAFQDAERAFMEDVIKAIHA
jgi:hypothetical protein